MAETRKILAFLLVETGLKYNPMLRQLIGLVRFCWENLTCKPWCFTMKYRGSCKSWPHPIPWIVYPDCQQYKWVLSFWLLGCYTLQGKAPSLENTVTSHYQWNIIYVACSRHTTPSVLLKEIMNWPCKLQLHHIHHITKYEFHMKVDPNSNLQRW